MSFSGKSVLCLGKQERTKLNTKQKQKRRKEIRMRV